MEAQMIDHVFVNGESLPIKQVKIDMADADDNIAIALVAGKRIGVVGFMLIAVGAVTIQFDDGAAGTNLTGAMPAATLLSSPALMLQFQTSEGVALIANLSGAVQFCGYINYVEI